MEGKKELLSYFQAVHRTHFKTEVRQHYGVLIFFTLEGEQSQFVWPQIAEVKRSPQEKKTTENPD